MTPIFFVNQITSTKNKVHRVSVGTNAFCKLILIPSNNGSSVYFLIHHQGLCNAAPISTFKWDDINAKDEVIKNKYSVQDKAHSVDANYNT